MLIWQNTETDGARSSEDVGFAAATQPCAMHDCRLPSLRVDVIERAVNHPPTTASCLTIGRSKAKFWNRGSRYLGRCANRSSCGTIVTRLKRRHAQSRDPDCVNRTSHTTIFLPLTWDPHVFHSGWLPFSAFQLKKTWLPIQGVSSRFSQRLSFNSGT